MSRLENKSEEFSVKELAPAHSAADHSPAFSLGVIGATQIFLLREYHKIAACPRTPDLAQRAAELRLRSEHNLRELIAWMERHAA